MPAEILTQSRLVARRNKWCRCPSLRFASRGFGIAFRVQGNRFEYIYLRPTNGRADDQIRRNHFVTHEFLHTHLRIVRSATPQRLGFFESEPGRNSTDTNAQWCCVVLELVRQKSVRKIGGKKYGAAPPYCHPLPIIRAAARSRTWAVKRQSI
jgi:hypothetical protein